jgi:uncharacterized integral membrane protein (TIGR00697 family)
MLYTAVSVAADVVAYKYTRLFGLVESGATILFPLTYVLGDVISETYGWGIAMRVVWFGLFSEAIFAICIVLVLHLPSYGIGHYQNEYNDVLGNIWLFVCAGIIADSIAGLLNIYIISRYKVRWEGKFFWLRSIIATLISEFILIFITVIIAFTSEIKLHETIHVFWDAYKLEIFYAIMFAIPAQLLSSYLKKSEGIDVYDYGISYNPFKFI